MVCTTIVQLAHSSHDVYPYPSSDPHSFHQQAWRHWGYTVIELLTNMNYISFCHHCALFLSGAN